jgi:hypothetical protein
LSFAYVFTRAILGLWFRDSCSGGLRNDIHSHKCVCSCRRLSHDMLFVVYVCDDDLSRLMISGLEV